MANERKELPVYSMLKSKSAKPVAVKAPKLSSPLSPVGKMLENVNVRPTRMQTAKYDAAYVFNSTKEINNPKTKVGKAINTLMSGALAAGTAPVSAFNILSGQSRYNKNKRAGLERGSGDFSVKKTNVPAETTVAELKNTAPSRLQTAKKDALRIYNENKEIHNPKSEVGKAANTAFSGALAIGTAPLSAANVVSGQISYGKNKKSKDSESSKVRNSSIPLAPTEFNED